MEPRVVAYAADRLGHVFDAGSVGLGVDVDGEIRAALVFHGWTGPDVHMSAAGEPRGWTRGLFAAVREYAFCLLGCERITLITEDLKNVDLSQRLGGKIEGLKRNQFGPGRDGYLVGFLKAEWRF